MKKLIESKEFEYSSFVGGWYVDRELCDELIDYYNFNEKYTYEGPVGSKQNIDKDCKESKDLSIGAGNNDNIIKVYREKLQNCLELYLSKYEFSNCTNRFSIVEDYQIQKYPIKGGFKQWHFENAGYGSAIYRHLVFMTYLNDVEDGGTEFFYQGIKTKAEKGLTLIWPSGWTHTHKGVVSDTKEKFIVTGWYSFLANTQT